MGRSRTAEMDGVVTIVQEGRFQLTDGEGVSHQFVLGRFAAAETLQLRPLMGRQAHIRVEYSDAPGLIGLIAHRIQLLDAAPPKET